MWLALVAGALVLVAAAGGLAWLLGRDGGAAAAGVCEQQKFPAQEAYHSPPRKIPKNFEYSSFPPTSGPHDPSPAVFGVYDNVVGQRHLIHNLEHGGIVIQYGEDVRRETIDEMVAWYRSDPNGIVIAPLPREEKAEKLRGKITLAAWWAEFENPDDPTAEPVREEGRLLTCSRFDEEAFSDFRDANRAHGPERFELEQLAPGS